ncbi:SRPBCC domain-containing protein [Amycolatopsis taiwanensis]|uniref:SRPBCC domain-containing protein n=1 Tax=Amycolatopsis taiwanensis TaxID=342230 RepID=UPI0006934588|nr:SRPBCC domain-containing protein [Amycolatopsis taiwanensis]
MQENSLRIRVAAAIAATPEQVWRVLIDVPRYRRWHPTLELLDGPPAGHLAPGAVLRWRTNQGTPTEREFDVTVTEVTEPLTLAWEGGDPGIFFGRHSFTVVPEGDGTRLVDEEVFSGAMAQTLLAEHRTALEAEYHAGAVALKAVVEQQNPQRTI